MISDYYPFFWALIVVLGAFVLLLIEILESEKALDVEKHRTKHRTKHRDKLPRAMIANRGAM